MNFVKTLTFIVTRVVRPTSITKCILLAIVARPVSAVPTTYVCTCDEAGPYYALCSCTQLASHV